MSDCVRMSPPTIGRVLLKQISPQYQHRDELDRAIKLTTKIPVIESLNPREIEVLKLAARGISNKGIAKILVISEQTVKSSYECCNRK